MDKQSEEYFDKLVHSLDAGEILAIPTKSGPIFRGKGKGCIPDGYGKRVMEDGTSVDGYFYAFRPSGKGKLKMDDGIEYEGEWRDGVLEIESPKISFKLIIGNQEFFVVQKNEDGTFDKYQGSII